MNLEVEKTLGKLVPLRRAQDKFFGFQNKIGGLRSQPTNRCIRKARTRFTYEPFMQSMGVLRNSGSQTQNLAGGAGGSRRRRKWNSRTGEQGIS